MTTQPDIFTNVHKGIRSALFAACTALGRAGEDQTRVARARALLRDALHFVRHHGKNEDELLQPLLRERASDVHRAMLEAHERVNVALESLSAELEGAPPSALYLHACRFLALYLEHMREEEEVFDPAIRASVPAQELAAFGRHAVERTLPADQRLMLGWMLPAMAPEDVEQLLSRVPPEAQADLRRLAQTPGA